MSEQQIHQQRVLFPSGSSTDDETAGGLVTVVHAPYAEALPVGEMTVRQVREQFNDRLDIHPEAVAFVNGSPADDDTVLREGQRLMFMRPSGEKGAKDDESVIFRGTDAIATLPEGNEFAMGIGDLMARLRPSRPDSCGAVLPDGTKSMVPIPGGFVLVHQTPPQAFGFRWIAPDSEAEFGPETKYRIVRVGLPYVIVLAYFMHPRRGVPVLGPSNECYFSNQPLETAGLDTPLAYPALLNCSKMTGSDPDDLPMSWICTQHLPRRETRGRTLDEAIARGLGALLRHLFESGFNRSSEHHEGASGFSATVDAKIDDRLSSIEAWEAATLENALFAVDVPWLPVGKTLREILERNTSSRRRKTRPLETAADLARLIVNAQASQRGAV